MLSQLATSSPELGCILIKNLSYFMRTIQTFHLQITVEFTYIEHIRTAEKFIFVSEITVRSRSFEKDTAVRKVRLMCNAGCFLDIRGCSERVALWCLHIL